MTRATAWRTSAALLALLPAGCGWMFGSANRDGGNRQAGTNSAQPMPPLPPMPLPSFPGGSSRPQLEPGQYEFRVRNELLSATGFPDQVLAPMREQLSRAATTSRSCVTPQEASSNDYGLGTGLRQAGCQPEGLRTDGGRLSGTMACNFNGVPARGEVNGLVTRDSVFLQLTVTAAAPGDMRQIRVRTEVNGSRLGDCPAGGGFPAPGGFPPGGGPFSPPGGAMPQGGGGK